MAGKLVNSVKKALDVLDILVFEDLNRAGMPLSVLSRRTGIPANTLHGLVTTLVACGYVRQKDDSSYFAGHKIDDVGKQNIVRRQLAAKIPDLMDLYRERTGESIVFYTLINAEKIPVHAVNRKGLFNINFDELRQTEFFQVPTSRVMFAFASPEIKNAIISRWGMPGEAWNNIESSEQLTKEAKIICERGFDESISHGGLIYSVAFPVLDGNSNLFGAVGLYAPTAECDDARKASFQSEMRSFCMEVSHMLN